MQNKKGFTLIELLVVVLIIGIQASVAIPQYFKVVEKGRASEAISMLSSICAAQERELLRNGSFETSTLNLDINVPVMKFFNPPVLTAGAAGTGANATITIQRKAANPAPPAAFGAYTLTLTYAGAGVKTITCATAGTDPCTSLVP